MAHIFKTTNLVTGRFYIGQSILDRTRYYGSGKILKQSILKYGKKNFKKEILIKGDFNQILLDELEIHYIRLYNSNNRNIGYNIEPGGSGNKKRLSQYTKDKIRQKQLGKKWSKETRIKIMAIRSAIIMNHSKGIENCRLHNLQTSKKIEQLDIEGKRLNVFNSIKEAAIKTNSDRTGIIKYLKSNKAELGKTYKGFIYRVIQ